MNSNCVQSQTNGQKTKIRLLKTAEKLFASHGFAGVTMRGVATMAQTNIASANYHFGTKEAMVLEMLKSKIGPINKKRKERLAEAKHNSCNNPLPTSEIFRALILPVGEEVQKHFSNQSNIVNIISRSFTEPASFLEKIHKHFFGELSQIFIDELKLTYPDANEDDIYWNFHFAIASMLGAFAQHRRIKDLTQGRCNENAVSEMIERLINFVSSGFEAGMNKRL